MSDNNRIFDDMYRENFMKTADPMSLNEYIKNMSKLAQRKGGRFMEIYNKDLDYLVNINDTQYQDGGDLSTLFSQIPKKQQVNEQHNNTMTEVCDTEAYIGRINNLTKNSYCNITTQNTGICDNTCDARFQELETIKRVLNPDCKAMNLNHVKAIRKFIDIIMCCGDLFASNEYEPLRTIYFKDLSKVITKNDAYVKEAFSYLTKILQNEKNKLSEAFMQDYAALRKAKPTTPRAQHKANKERLIGDYINRLGPEGFQKVYSSKLVEKVINSYKKMMVPR